MRILQSKLPWFDQMVWERTAEGSGLPTGSWIMLSGAPGSGKTTVGLALMDALLKEPRTVGLYLNEEMTAEKRISMIAELQLPRLLEPRVATHDRLPEQGLEDLLMGALSESPIGHVLLVFLDSLQSLYKPGSNTDAYRLAQLLLQLKRDQPVVLITVGHLNKNKQYAGPALFARACDVRVDCRKDPSGFFHLDTSQKNRYYNPQGKAAAKLQRTPQGLVPSAEPDFISNNPIVAGVRGLLRRR